MKQLAIKSLSFWGISLGILKYPALYVGAIIEGPILMAAAGFMVKLGYLKFFPAYILLVLGDWTGDFFWYGLGYFYGKNKLLKHGKYFGLTEKRIERAEQLFKKHENKVMLISKMTMGFGLALVTLITSGIMKISLKKFAFFNLLGELFLTAVLMGLGYLLANGYIYVNEGLQYFYIFAWIVIISASLYGFTRFMRHKYFSKEL